VERKVLLIVAIGEASSRGLKANMWQKLEATKTKTAREEQEALLSVSYNSLILVNSPIMVFVIHRAPVAHSCLELKPSSSTRLISSGSWGKSGKLADIFSKILSIGFCLC